VTTETEQVRLRKQSTIEPLQKELAARAARLSVIDLSSIVPLFVKYNGVLEQDRTGILFAVGNRHFIVTAAHEVNRYAKHLCYLYVCGALPGSTVINLVGDVHSNEEHDVSVISLTSEVANELVKGHRFLRTTDVDASSNERPESYVIMGYPLAKPFHQKRPHEKRISSIPFTFFTALNSDEVESELGYDPSVHLLFKNVGTSYAMDGSVISTPRFQGMSGGADFRYPSGSQSADSVERRLVGVQISAKAGGFVKATRIWYALRLIADHYPDCANAIEIGLE